MSDSRLTYADDRRRFGGAALAIALAVGLALGGIAVWALSRPEEPAEEAEEHVELPPGIVELPEAAQKNASVELVKTSATTLPATIDVTGTVTADESRVAHIRPLGKGLVQNVSVRLGDRVNAGQVLATLDYVELGEFVGVYMSEIAALRQAEADLDVKSRSLDRANELIKLEGIAQRELDLRQAEFKNAEAAVASQRARVAKVEEQIHRFGVDDEHLRRMASGDDHRTESLSAVRAPIEGIVTKYDITPGELVESDRELFTIANISTVWVLADVYEKDLAKVKTGADVSIRVEAYPDRPFIGRLTYIADLIDPQTRTARARCVVPNPDSALKVDMFARVAIPTTEARHTTVVPIRAVQQVDGQSVVFVQQSPTRFERRIVRTGVTAGELIEIASGVKTGETVVGSGSFYLKTALLRERIGDDH